MRFNFTEEQKKNELNKIEIEDEDIVLFGEYVEGSGREFVITGKAIIEDETYNDFQIEFILENEAENDIEEIMESDWESYDFLC